MEVELSGHDESKMLLISQPNCQSKDRYHDVAWQQGLTMHFLSCLLSPSPLSCMKFSYEVKITHMRPVQKRAQQRPWICGFFGASCSMWHEITEADSRHRYHLCRMAGTQMWTETTLTCLPWRGMSSKESHSTFWRKLQKTLPPVPRVLFIMYGQDTSGPLWSHVVIYCVALSLSLSPSIYMRVVLNSFMWKRPSSPEKKFLSPNFRQPHVYL